MKSPLRAQSRKVVPVRLARREASDHLRDRLAKLSEFLIEHEELWREAPWDREPAWGRRHPTLLAWVEQQTTADRTELEALSLAPWGAEAPEELRAWQETGEQLTRLPRLQRVASLPSTEPSRSESASHRIPLRKWQQVQELASVVLALRSPSGRYVDCCAGKGHLGRTLGRFTGRPLVLVDQDPSLCRKAAQLASRQGVAATVCCADVLTGAFSRVLQPDDLAVALHACGDLHLALAEQVISDRLHSAVLAPCCFYRTRRLPFAGLSRDGRCSGLRLDRAALSFATCGTAVAPAGTRARLARKQAWHFAFSAWYRRTSGGAWPHPQREISRRTLAGDFTAFCVAMAKRGSVPPPEAAELSRLEADGWRFLSRAFELERVRHPFRRALEIWLLVDRALWLEEAGVDVEIGTFCSPALTPRNVAWVLTAR